MSRCVCSTRALEIFVKDVAGITIRSQRPLPFVLRQSRGFATKPTFRQEQSVALKQLEENTIPLESAPDELHSTSVVSHLQKWPNPTSNGTRGREDEHEDKDWHAEIQIATRSGKDVNPPGVIDPVSWNEAQQTEKAADGTDTAVSKLSSEPADVLESASHTAGQTETTTNESGRIKSRMESRLERKLRRIRSGQWRAESEARKLEQVENDEREAILQRIKAMDDGESTRTPPGSNNEQASTGEESSETTTDLSPIKKAETAVSAKPVNQGATTVETKPISKVKKEDWQVQKAALGRKFGEQGWQPRKRLSPDTLEGIRALHASDPGAYTTATLAKHFEVAPEAVRRILKSKWRPNEAEAEDRRKRWEKRGVRKWEEMAEQGMRPPAKWRAMGVRNPDLERKKANERQRLRYEQTAEEDEVYASQGVAERIL